MYTTSSKNFKKKVLLSTSYSIESDGPRIWSGVDDCFIRKAASQSLSFAQKIMAERDIKINEKTIKGRFSMNFGLKSLRLAKKSRLAKVMIKQHLEFAETFGWGREMRENVLFSEEYSIKQFSLRKYRV